MVFFFPRDVLDEIWDLIESVSEGLSKPLTSIQSLNADSRIQFKLQINVYYSKFTQGKLLYKLATENVCKHIYLIIDCSDFNSTSD